MSTAEAMFANVPPPCERAASYLPLSLALSVNMGCLAAFILAIISFSSNSALLSSRNGVVTCFSLPTTLLPASSIYLSTHCSRKLDMSYFITCTSTWVACLGGLISNSEKMIGASFLGVLTFVQAYLGLYHWVILVVPMLCWHPRNLPICCGGSILIFELISFHPWARFARGPASLKSST